MPIQGPLFDLCLMALAVMAFYSLLHALSDLARGALREGMQMMLCFLINILLYPAFL